MGCATGRQKSSLHNALTDRFFWLIGLLIPWMIILLAAQWALSSHNFLDKSHFPVRRPFPNLVVEIRSRYTKQS
jgi:hypothetical protein